MKNTVKYYIEDYNNLSDYSLNFLFWFCGCKGVRAAKITGRKFNGIYYGNNKEVEALLTIPVVNSDLVWKELIQNQISARKIERVLPFDIIGACARFLTDAVNAETPGSSYDAHNRLNYAGSFQCKNGLDSFPIVNKYAQFFRELLLTKFNADLLPQWPLGKKCCIGLSHDADRPVKYQILKNFHYNRNWNMRERLYHTGRYVYNLRKWLFDRSRNDFWLFDEVMKEESRYNFKSTFFIASYRGYWENGSVYDVFYDAGWKEFEKLFDKIESDGYEIGLHASYNAYLDKNNFINEKNKLQKLAGINVLGLRHHYWHMGKDMDDTLLKHEESGFKYDSSIAFNDHIGFRRNTAFPYYPFNIKEGREINCLQLPVFCMDGNLFNSDTNVQHAVDTIANYIKTIKESDGIGIIDWHSETSFPRNDKYFNWGVAYTELLKMLSEDSSIWVTSLENIYSWFNGRRKAINDLGQSPKPIKTNYKFSDPAPLEH